MAGRSILDMRGRFGREQAGGKPDAHHCRHAQIGDAPADELREIERARAGAENGEFIADLTRGGELACFSGGATAMRQPSITTFCVARKSRGRRRSRWSRKDYGRDRRRPARPDKAPRRSGSAPSSRAAGRAKAPAAARHIGRAGSLEEFEANRREPPNSSARYARAPRRLRAARPTGSRKPAGKAGRTRSRGPASGPVSCRLRFG